MHRAQPLLEGGRAHRGRDQHMRPRGHVRAIRIGRRQPVMYQPQPFQRDAIRHRMEARRAECLDAMRQRIHAGRRGDMRRQAERQFRVGNHHAGHHGRVEDDPLGRRVLVDDDRGTADLRPRPRRGRHGHDRRDAGGIDTLPVVARILVIEQRPGLPGHQCDGLGRVDGAAAAEGDHAVMPAATIGRNAIRHIVADRVALYCGEQPGRHVRRRVGIQRIAHHW